MLLLRRTLCIRRLRCFRRCILRRLLRKIRYRANRAIGPCGRCFPLARKRQIDRIRNEHVDHREHRHTQQHPRKAEDARRQRDGDQHPEARNADRIAQNLWADDVAVQLLQTDHKNDKVERLQGIYQQNQKRTGHRADDGAKERNDIGHTDDRRNQRRIRQPENQHTDIADHADNGRVNDLADDKAIEDFIGFAAKIEQMIDRFRPEHGHQYLFGLCLEQILRPEDIDRGDQTDQQIGQPLDNRDDRGRNGRDDLLHIGQKTGFDVVFQIIINLIQRRIHISADGGVVGQNAVNPAFNAAVVILGAVDDADDAFIQLRQQHGEERIDDERRKHQRKDDGRRAAELFRLHFGLWLCGLALFQPRAKPRIDKAHQRIEQEGKHTSGYQRREDRPNGLEHGKKARQVSKNDHQQDADKDHGQRCHANLKIGLVPIGWFLLRLHASIPLSTFSSVPLQRITPRKKVQQSAA